VLETRPLAMTRSARNGVFRELLEAATDAILEVDALGRIVLVNATGEKLSAYSRSVLLG